MLVMASKMHLLCCSRPSGLLHSRGVSVGANDSSSNYGSVVRCTKSVRRNKLFKGKICASYGEETCVGKLAVVTLLAQSMVVSSAFADVELLNESQRMRLEMLQQIEQSLQQQQQQTPIETQTSPLPVAPALEAPSLTLKEELPSPSTLPSPSPSPSPSASTSTPIEAAPPSPPATIEEPSPSSSAPIVETPAVIEKPSLPPSLSANPNPAEVVTTPNMPSPSEAPAQSSAAQSTDVEAGSNNVLGLIGVVGAALLGASFLQEKKQEPVANSPSDANATQSKEAVGPASTSGIESVEGNKLADD